MAGRQFAGVPYHGSLLAASRPRHFFREDGEMPESVTLVFAKPKALSTCRRLSLRNWSWTVRQVEEVAAESGGEKGTRVLGRKAVLNQRWSERPASREPRRELNPGSPLGANGAESKPSCGTRPFATPTWQRGHSSSKACGTSCSRREPTGFSASPKPSAQRRRPDAAPLRTAQAQEGSFTAWDAPVRLSP